MAIRVRYAPSPTGYQHIGGVRTAFFDYLFAKANGGKFILRIEDTDRERFRDDALQDIYDTFSWLGVKWDEGPDVGGEFSPYIQTERKTIYQKYVDELISNGYAYYCYCTSERLTELRSEQEKNKIATGYDRRCRDLSPAEQQKFRQENPHPVIRLKIPLTGSTKFTDELLGTIERENIDINPDPVLLKSDGFPTYHLANVIDDHLMQISHIFRSQEWIPSVPIHIHLYNAFGWEPPQFIHLPMVKGEDGRKLGKRHGATHLLEFKKQGYLPEAILNYIALLGWSFDDSREFFTLKELEELFSLKKINKASAVFDYKKLNWFNGIYIRKKTDEEVQELIIPSLVEAGYISLPLNQNIKKLIKGIIPLIKERITLLSDTAGLTDFFFQEISDKIIPQDLIPKKTDIKKTLEIFEGLIALMKNFEELSDEENERLFREKAASLDVKLGNFLQPLRVALTGSKVSLPLFESLRLLGCAKAIQRINIAINLVKQM